MSAGFDNKINPGLNKPQEPKITQANSANIKLSNLNTLPGQDLELAKTGANPSSNTSIEPVRTLAPGRSIFALGAKEKVDLNSVQNKNTTPGQVHQRNIPTPNTDECIKLAKACLG